jgi:copper(I)-binding protein
MKSAAVLLGVWLFWAITETTSAAQTMDVTGGWVREAPPTSRVLAAYMQIVNLTDADLTITGISSPDFDAAELHRTVVEGGVARMLPVPELTIPAAGSVLLEPGGLHLMLFDPVHPLVQGNSVTLVLHRSDGICLTLPVPVLRSTGDENVQHHHHH